MAPPKQGGGGLSLRTLVIASFASLTAAIVTSRLFPPGTVYASALTPVIVAAVNELLSRPANRMAALREQRRTLVLESRRSQAARVSGEEGTPLLGAPDFALGADAPEANGNGHHDDALERVEIYTSARRRRILHPKLWVVTGLVAFLIAAAALTLPELIFGGAVATQHETTLFGGGSHHTTTAPKTQTTTTSTQTTPTQTTPAATQTHTTQTTTTDTGTTTTDTTTTSGGTPAPSDTGTSTSPLPPAP